jgi:apolipoprotein N-acyltransferase
MPRTAPPAKQRQRESPDATPSALAATVSSTLSGPTPIAWLRPGSTFTLALLGGLLLWLAFPPVGAWPLAWIAPVPWVLLARRPWLPGRRPYLALWVAGFAFWMGVLHWLTLPHWATNFGWVALSFYLAFYLPVFVGLTRVAVHRCGVSVVLAAPVVWTGLELARGHLLTGFTMASLGHTQTAWIELIQVADLAGAYGVGFVIMLVAACLGRMLPCDGRPRAFWPLVLAVATLAAVLAYGAWRTSAPPGPVVAKVALIQGSIDTTFEYNPHRAQEVFSQYHGLTRQALAEHPDVDLIVWPETMFGAALGIVEDQAPRQTLSPEAESELRHIRDYAQASAAAIANTAREFSGGRPDGPAWLLGVEVWRHRGGQRPDEAERYNSALFVEPSGSFQARYDKMHPVMFGEYVPLGDTFPWLYRLTPMSGGIQQGIGPRAFRLGDLRLSPSICYETVVPHLIRRQVLELRAAGEEPNVLVNLTNDGWFWGSAELDLHLACGVFRAIECRKPLLVAANTGFSAWIDGDGRVLSQGPRHATGHVIATIATDPRDSLYLRHGDLLAAACLICCLGLAVVGLVGRYSKN